MSPSSSAYGVAGLMSNGAITLAFTPDVYALLDPVNVAVPAPSVPPSMNDSVRELLSAPVIAESKN